jgi:RNA polymerase sigma-70 factor, ECF subfamily
MRKLPAEEQMNPKIAFSPKNISSVRPVINEALDFREKNLVAAAKSGCAAAFEELCLPYMERLRQRTYRITKNWEDGEDALQDSLLRAFVHLKNFDGRSAFSTWLTRIATNSALMILRKKRSSYLVALDHSEDPRGSAPVDTVADANPNPETHCSQREQEQILRGAILQLRPKIRRAVELQQLEENSLAQTAQILGITLAATKGRLFHAKTALRKALQRNPARQSRGRRHLRVLTAA